MNRAAILDTSFLISLVNKERPGHETAKAYYRYFLENDVTMLLPTIVVAEFAVKQSPDELPLRNFEILPFNYVTAKICADLNVVQYRIAAGGQGQRDAVKDDFKIMGHAAERQCQSIISEDEETMARYGELLRANGKVNFSVISIKRPFDAALVNGTGQTELGLGNGSS